MNPLTICRCLQVCTLVLVLGGTVSARAVDTAAWQQDLDFVIEKLITRHADPWALVHEKAFRARADRLRSNLHALDDSAITVELMKLVAGFQDGHTKLLPTGPLGFRHWYPLRLHRFADGIYLTSMPDAHQRLRGLRITRINGLDPDDVLDRVTALLGADNRFGRQAFAFLASSADLLDALDVVGKDRHLQLEFAGPDGGVLSESFAAEVVNEDMDWRFWGEMFGPVGVESNSAWGGAALDLLSRADPGRPLHLRQRNAYYWEYLPEHDTVYFQLNVMSAQSSQSDASLAQSWSDALAASRSGEEGAQRFVIDLRYNFGGDGSLVKGLVSQFLRGYPRALEPGRVFVVTGGATFSAGVMMVEELFDHVPVVRVGEPMGAPLNSYGDAETFQLPNSGFQLDISRRFWQLSMSDDDRDFIPVQIPAALSGRQYFDGQDAVLEQILSAPAPYPTIDRVLMEQGSAAAQQAFSEQHLKWSAIDYWQPLGRMDLEHAADRLIAAGRREDAVTAYRLNTWIFPDDWDTWDDLGQACLDAGDSGCVRTAFLRALQLNPSNWNAAEQRQALDELDAAP